MRNRIPNSSGLDGATGWAAGSDLVVDSINIGAEARIAITGGASVSAPEVNVAGLTAIYASALFQGQRAFVRFNVGGDVVIPLRRRASRSATRGIASTFSLAAGVLAVPGGATTARIIADGLANGNALFRPYLDAYVGERPSVWTPGPHLNPDLDLVAWPGDLRNAEADGVELEPIALRKSFAGDDGTPTTRRVASTSRYFMTMTLALDNVQRDRLDQFWRANHDEFFLIRPDTGDLVIAEWADDGDPRDSGGRPPLRRTEIRVLIREP